MHFKLVRGKLGLIATLRLQGNVTREECERQFRERCLADKLVIDEPVYTLVQPALDGGYETGEAESTAYILNSDRLTYPTNK